MVEDYCIRMLCLEVLPLIVGRIIYGIYKILWNTVCNRCMMLNTFKVISASLILLRTSTVQQIKLPVGKLHDDVIFIQP